MGAAKRVSFEKDWWISKEKSRSARKVHRFEQIRVTKSEDLPQLMTTLEAAELLRRHPKTIEEYRKQKLLKFMKLKGRYFTTPEWIAEFIEREAVRA
jgi:hypothetical protein